jgi:hypothetical protein
MQYYSNLGGNSGVYAYEIASSHIKVQFRDGSIYLYSYITPGNSEVERMKSLALAGRGLNSYISTYIKKRYAAKLR